MKLTVGVIGDKAQVECTCGAVKIFSFKDNNQYYCDGCSTEYDIATILKGASLIITKK